MTKQFYLKTWYTGLLLTVMSVIPSYAADGDEFTVGNLKYTVISETDCTVCVKYDASSGGLIGDLIIPDIIDHASRQYKVTVIGYKAFCRCLELVSVVIPSSVTTIGDEAFSSCYDLTSVVIPSSVTTIGESAFNSCSSLTSLSIPNSVTTIGKWAFGACRGLTSITLSNSVTTIGERLFYNCDRLTSVSIPNSVMTIGEYAFHLCESLKSVAIPNSVIKIGKGAFCSAGLEFIDIPNSVTEIGEYCFYGCRRLTSVTIPNSVMKMDGNSFLGCSSLVSISVDGGNQNYTSSKGVLFNKDMTVLIKFPNAIGTEYIIPNSVKKIGEDAFYSSDLVSIAIPSSVEAIGERAFNSCISLASVTIPNSVVKIEDSSFGNCRRLANVIIPNSVETIGEGAFVCCLGLTSVTIGTSVTQIGKECFFGCRGLKEIYSLALTPPELGRDVFESLVDAVLYVPGESLTAYSCADNWKDFIIMDIAEAGVGCIDVLGSEEVSEYYNINGIRVSNPGKGLYIKRLGGKATKVLVK